MAKTKEVETSKDFSAEMPKVLKSFKNNSDIEGFYRFVYESDLRLEANALMRLRGGISEKTKAKRTRKKKAKKLQ